MLLLKRIGKQCTRSSIILFLQSHYGLINGNSRCRSARALSSMLLFSNVPQNTEYISYHTYILSVTSFQTCSVFHLKTLHDAITIVYWDYVSSYFLLHMSVNIDVSPCTLQNAGCSSMSSFYKK